MAAVNGSGASGGISPTELAAMLRKSAEIVAKGDFHPILYQTMKALTVYAGDYAQGNTAKPATSASGNNSQRQRGDAQGKAKSAFHDVPDSLLDSSGKQQQSQKAAGRSNRSSGGSSSQFSSNDTSASSKSQEKQQKGGFTKGLKGIRKGFEKLGADLIKDNNDDVPFDEQEWKRKNMDKTRDSFSEQQQESPTKMNNESDKKSKPCFQRPINPNSNLIANGWIDQQRRSKMRVVWKDVLASLVEGRRPGEETTLWIQRQVVDPQTGKITGLEALHQIPMKWLEDVNFVDSYGDYRFTLKVYNFAEEFYFRTRDEQSAQSWVITLRSARDASLESIGRMPGNDDDKWMRKESPPKEMGLDSLDSTVKSQSEKPAVSVEQATAQAGNDSSEKNRTSPVQTQQQPPTSSGRMKISELRAIAHGAGFDTRGMERKDLEKIAAIVSGTIPATHVQESDSIRQSQQREAMMRDAERKQREKREKREREEREREETLKEQQAEREKVMAEQRRQQEEAQRQRQIEEIKRRQEEERLKRVAEIQAAEAKRKQEEENIRREQQQRSHIPTPPSSVNAQYQQQHQGSHIPTPPSSGGVPFQQQHWQTQQQQQYQQWQQQQNPQQHAQYQQQSYANQHQSHQSQNPQFFPQQASGYPSNFQQQNQPQPQHHPQQQQQQQCNATDSKYAKQMEEQSEEEQLAANSQIKRSILINWALQPPNLNVLRPIDQLITSIHTAMPPAFGVPGHSYFSKFTPIPHSDLVLSAAMGNHPDENKLKKAVRKVRVFLHPDKLPRDLSSEQSYMARMLWDITSDSWEEFLKHKDELDWIQG